MRRQQLAFIGLAVSIAASMGCDDGETGVDVANATDRDEPDVDIGDDREVWVVMQSHLHTTGQHACANNPLEPGPLPEGECFSGEGVTGFLEAALDYGAADMIITDHNNIGAWFDPAFAPLASTDLSRYATPLRGSEWSSGQGHLTLFFPRQVATSNQQAIDEGWIWAAGNHSKDPTDDDYFDIMERVHTRGGLVVINHPKLLIHPFPDNTYGADGVEVGVKVKPFLQSSSSTRRWWHQRLLATDRITAMAGSDHHHGGGDLPFLDEPIFGVAVNLMRIDTSLPNAASVEEALQDPARTIDRRSDIAADAIRRGHVMVVEDLARPRVFLGADTDGDGRFHNARAGDCVPPSAITAPTVPVRVRVTQAADEGISGHYNVLVYDHNDTGHWLKLKLDPERGFKAGKGYRVDPVDPFAFEVDVPVDPARPGFIRAEIERDVLGPLNDMKTLSNPIYFGDWGAECDGSAPLK